MESAIVTLSCYSGLLELMETYWTEEMKVDGQFCEAFQPKLFSKLGGTVEQFNLCKFKQFLLLLTFQQLQKGEEI